MARRKKSGRDLHGILLLDKRSGVSSNKALQEVRGLYKANKGGHTGSLDPLASGLLPVCFGEATKVSAFMLNEDKRYHVEIQLGICTDTGDAEGLVTETKAIPEIESLELRRALKKFVGDIQQIPPMYSALKHQGKKLYQLAREGKTIERQARPITIFQLECLEFTGDRLLLDVCCSKGTYIRTLAEDIGKELTCGASVRQLRRLAVGSFTLQQAYTLDELQQQPCDAALLDCLLPVDVPLLSWSSVQLADQQARQIQQGGQVALSGTHDYGKVRMYSQQSFLGIGEILTDGKLIPKRLFHIV